MQFGIVNTCPVPTALTAITMPTCPFRFDQIVKIFLQRRQSATPFADLTALQTASNWATLVAASDATKIVYTPVVSNLVVPPSEAIFQAGGDNATFNGVPEYMGEGMVSVTGEFRNMPPAQKVLMNLLTQYSISNAIGLSGLTAYFLNRDGYLFYNEDPSGFLAGIPLYNWGLGSTGSQGLYNPNLTPLRFHFPPGWDNTIKSTKPAFDMLTTYA